MRGIWRGLKLGFLAVLAVVLVTLSLANRESVTLTALPGDLAALVGWNASLELPLFLVILCGVAAGLLVGFVWEWLRERRIRAEAAQARREITRLEGEVGRLRSNPPTATTPAQRSEVLALAEQRR